MDLPPLVRLISVLDGLDPVLHLESNFTGLLFLFQTAVHQLTTVADVPHGAHNGCSASTEDLNHAAFLGSLRDIRHADLALRNDPALGLQSLTSEREDGISCHTLEDSAIEGSSDQLLLSSLLILQGDEQVHCANLGHVFLFAEEPQVLLETAGSGLELGQNARSIIGTELLVTNTAGPGADSVIGSLKRDGLKASRVVRADGASNNKQKGGARRTNTQSLLSANHSGPEVQRVTTGTATG